MSDAERLAERTLQAARARGLRIVTAESCTGGLVCAALTDLPGASDVVEAGIVSYANAAKVALLGVPAALLDSHGAVSAQTARAMADGALERTGADLSVAVTGIAGPGGGSIEKPVGLVYFATAGAGGETRLHREVFPEEGREAIRQAAVRCALNLLLDRLG